MIKILANDGIGDSGRRLLESEGFSITTKKIKQDDLIDIINKENYQVLLVRSATTARKKLIDSCPNLKIIGRGGVGMDNIDVEYAEAKGLKIYNTPASSSSAVAELVFAHLFSLVRFLYESNRKMPLEGDQQFKELKKSFSNGQELTGKTLGIIGFGRIGQEVAKRGIGLGMKIISHDKYIKQAKIILDFFNNQNQQFLIKTISLKKLLSESDFITIHVPKTSNKPIIGTKEISIMKTGSGIINTSRGGLVDEDSLMNALNEGKLQYAGLDVFKNEPSPSIHLLMHEKISLTPHIGAATKEAQERISEELANKIIYFFKNQ